ncbi:hypothetical protein BO82DRAFT_355313 [Aspergillus uvarum CBS 121591]|uniref:C2H2-type domain-containing protein n=1 Tax=Aspergillus uvarum CBS 121591 TaxID=1448315 RepID=A0A319C9Q8_9EURO|nr:hypothetical protein BO82DRAFT_355313 [Aspergillus uvarum CBS 121591]PYH80601.1 hypothetical protein BO82DRAFT_355313 [Aspergillus uvarum CBS 121591]
MDGIAREFHQSWEYIVSEDGAWLYKCPSCEKEFSELSSLFQHVEDILVVSFLSRGHGCLAKLERFVSRSLE